MRRVRGRLTGNKLPAISDPENRSWLDPKALLSLSKGMIGVSSCELRLSG
jgi:hypothetical protein